jgi:peptide methionine sulfoxide reductase MsrA
MKKNPNYQNIMDSTEAYLVEFDPSVISYDKLINVWASNVNPYYPSAGQYRSAVWYCNDTQLSTIQQKLNMLSKGGEKEVYVGVEPVTAFYKAEEYHQNYLEKQTSARVPRF